MSCKECDNVQDALGGVDNGAEITFTYIRVDNSNMMLVGCPKHLEETIRLINKGYDADGNGKQEEG
jgi:hypothetical protein